MRTRHLHGVSPGLQEVQSLSGGCGIMNSAQAKLIGVGDMVLLDPITEENLLKNLQKRFTNSAIYVWLCSTASDAF